MRFLVTSFAALTGTPMAGALLDRYGFYATIVWSGLCIFTGAALFAITTMLQRREKGREKGAWKV
jgi:MFS family permease